MGKNGNLKKQQISNKTRCQIILYASKIKYPRLPAYTYPIFALLKYIKLLESRKSFQVTMAPQEYLQEIFKSTPTCDTNNCILINENYHKAILNSSEYALLKFNNVERLVQIYPTNLEVTAVLAGDVLNYNLKELPTCQIKSLNLSNIKIAKQVELAFITQATTVGNAATDEALKNYFKTPKLVYKHDVIEINLQQYAPSYFYTNVKMNGIRSIYFKCIKVSSEKKEDCSRGYLGMLGITAIKQGSDVQSFLPPQRKLVQIGSDYCKRSFIDLCPWGLEKYYQKLDTAVKPFLFTKDLRIKPTFLLQGPRGSGKKHILNTLSKYYGLKVCTFSTVDINAHAYAQTETKLKNAFFKAKLCAPCIVVIQEFENICKNNEGHHDSRIANSFKAEINSLFESNENVILFIAECNTKDLPSELGRIFIETITFEAPDLKERCSILKWIISRKNLQTCKALHIEDVAGKTHGFLFQDLEALVFYAEQNFYNDERMLMDENNFDFALDIMQSNYTDSLGAPKVPKVNWSDVGGLEDVKNEIIKTINLPLKHPELLKTGLRRSGVLLFGPPGTGKTLLAKAVATECGLCFLSVKGPELLNMYVGQSEQNVREVFEKARQASPCIIFFDELDSLAPKRGISGDSGGVMDRVVSQLLSEMDGLNQDATIFVIGATNRPDLIDSSLLRPGRFDKLLYVGPCTDPVSKLGVLKALTRKFKLSDKVNLQKIIKTCPENITGADFYGICSNAWMLAASKMIQKIEKAKINHSEVGQDDVVVTFKDFEEAIKNAKPSVSKEDMMYFEQLRNELVVKK